MYFSINVRRRERYASDPPQSGHRNCFENMVYSQDVLGKAETKWRFDYGKRRVGTRSRRGSYLYFGLCAC